MSQAGLLRFFAPLWALTGVAQDSSLHPEGDAWVHTLLAVDQASRLRGGGAGRDLVLLFGALCHDLGKPRVTELDQGRIRALGHDLAGVEPTEQLLRQLDAPEALVLPVTTLVRHHMAPAQLVGCGAKAKAYRRLARKLAAGGVDLDLLSRLARADRLAHFEVEPPGFRFLEGQIFIEQAQRFGLF